VYAGSKSNAALPDHLIPREKVVAPHLNCKMGTQTGVKGERRALLHFARVKAREKKSGGASGKKQHTQHAMHAHVLGGGGRGEVAGSSRCHHNPISSLDALHPPTHCCPTNLSLQLLQQARYSSLVRHNHGRLPFNPTTLYSVCTTITKYRASVRMCAREMERDGEGARSRYSKRTTQPDHTHNPFQFTAQAGV
jgi:hypothetical protein